ncbi:hypothetical protein E2C01_025252 [Portunus trituberculatus]|uniref:Uncharacterized protein n=1 Tax=Portunus trituberculatus TaxID=210409 RepID=A0A5B7ECV3_PORTR|nr:hypothetical protein [Portunus trituberculatus]
MMGSDKKRSELHLTLGNRCSHPTLNIHCLPAGTGEAVHGVGRPVRKKAEPMRSQERKRKGWCRRRGGRGDGGRQHTCLHEN